MLRQENYIYFSNWIKLKEQDNIFGHQVFFFQYSLVILGLGLIALYTENLKWS